VQIKLLEVLGGAVFGDEVPEAVLRVVRMLVDAGARFNEEWYGREEARREVGRKARADREMREALGEI
jgi:hypothetical protein